MKKPITQQEQTILDRFKKSDGCWEWQGSADKKGRGRVYHNGKMKLHHRAVWNILKGEIPHGAFLCHHCDNPKCGNPDHLYVGDHASNTNDMLSRRRAWFQRNPEEARRRGLEIGFNGKKARGERSPRAKLKDEDVEYIRNSGARIIDMADKLGVSLSTIHRVKSGRGWTHIK